MIGQHSLLVTLIELVNRLPVPPPPAKKKRGSDRSRVYMDRLFLKALVVMIVRHLHTVNELLCVLAQRTPKMHTLRVLLNEQGKFPSRIGRLGRHLVALKGRGRAVRAGRSPR